MPEAMQLAELSPAPGCQGHRIYRAAILMRYDVVIASQSGAEGKQPFRHYEPMLTEFC